jgi:hypothetical protein
MFCTYCKQTRIENQAPCPNCGAPSPLLQISNFGQLGTIDSIGASESSQAGQGENRPNEMATSTALVPMNNPSPHQSTVTLQIIPQQAIEHLLPAQPEAPETVYVPPLFTKPRPLIPKYRIFSGALSLLIVVLLLCGGTSYYAKASGTIDRLIRAFTGGPPTVAITPTPVVLTDPPNKIDTGPAIDVIPSGTTTLYLDQNQNALEQNNKFTAWQAFYVTYNVQPPKGDSGKVTVKWYQNGKYWKTTSDDKTTITGPMNGYIKMVYERPAMGSVEIYWNDKLAFRLYFVVRPATS